MRQKWMDEKSNQERPSARTRTITGLDGEYRQVRGGVDAARLPAFSIARLATLVQLVGRADRPRLKGVIVADSDSSNRRWRVVS